MGDAQTKPIPRSCQDGPEGRKSAGLAGAPQILLAADRTGTGSQVTFINGGSRGPGSPTRSFPEASPGCTWESKPSSTPHMSPTGCSRPSGAAFAAPFSLDSLPREEEGSGNHVLSARRAVWAGDTGRWGLPRGSGLTVHRAEPMAQCLDRLLSCATAWKGILLFWGAAPPHVLGLPGSWGSPPHLTPISLSTADWLRGQPAPVPVPRASCRWLKVRQLRTSPEGGGNTSSLQSREVSPTLHEGKGGRADIHH